MDGLILVPRSRYRHPRITTPTTPHPSNTHPSPTLKRNMATSAAAASNNAAGWHEVHTGRSICTGPAFHSRNSPNPVCNANQAERLRTTPTTAAVIAESAACRLLFFAQGFDKRRPDEDEEEARHEGDPGRDRGAEQGGGPRIERARVAISGDEADELQDHHQRARCRFGEGESVDHLARLHPGEILDRTLGDIGEHRIGSAERDHSRLTEEAAFTGDDVVGAEPPRREQYWRDPEDRQTSRSWQRRDCRDGAVCPACPRASMRSTR